MQPHDVRRIDAAFEDLKVIRLLKKQSIDAVLIGNPQKFKVGQFRWIFRQPHVGPDNAAALHARITGVLHLLHELLRWRYIGHIDTLAVGGVLPGVIRAAKPVCFDAPEVKRRKPVWTISADEPDGAGPSAEQNQIFAEELDSHRPAAGLVQMRCRRYWNPVMAK